MDWITFHLFSIIIINSSLINGTTSHAHVAQYWTPKNICCLIHHTRLMSHHPNIRSTKFGRNVKVFAAQFYFTSCFVFDASQYTWSLCEEVVASTFVSMGTGDCWPRKFNNIHPSHFFLGTKRVPLHHGRTLGTPFRMEKFTRPSHIIKQSPTWAITLDIFQQSMLQFFFCFLHVVSGVFTCSRQHRRKRRGGYFGWGCSQKM